jgi:hypothetical protein
MKASLSWLPFSNNFGMRSGCVIKMKKMARVLGLISKSGRGECWTFWLDVVPGTMVPGTVDKKNDE